ncbi:MAG TPA: hypothetical protein VHD56_09115 [Tepidisphaeraceae bacterium]|nr:hypothetical protein [Tepidisphaeraceae bacterium]
MNDPSQPHPSDQTWEQGWDGHEREQRRRLANLPLAEKLAWLEEAQKVATHLQQSARQADDTASAGK